MDDHELDVLDVLRDITLTDRSFHSIVRFLDGNTRNHLVAAQLRNTNQSLAVLRMYMAQERRTENIVMNIPLGNLFDPSGNIMRNFFDPVQVTPTPAQIDAATENHVGVTETNCAICQEGVTCATRIRACGHCFHSHCIREWFTMNTRCPICRHDIRDLRPSHSHHTNDNRVHPDEE